MGKPLLVLLTSYPLASLRTVVPGFTKICVSFMHPYEHIHSFPYGVICDKTFYEFVVATLRASGGVRLFVLDLITLKIVHEEYRR